MNLPGWLRKLLGLAAEKAVDAVQDHWNDDTPRERRKPLDVGEKVRKVPRP